MSKLIAFLDSDNIVTQVVQSPDDGQDWVSIYAERKNCKCVETKIDGSIRRKFAKPGYTYHEDIDSFVEPCPYSSWVFNKTSKQWEAPVAMPDDENGDLIFKWDDSKENWVIAYDVGVSGPLNCIDC